jgi:uncharacterized protein YdeI (YjbR/CyaY-like superfamily)
VKVQGSIDDYPLKGFTLWATKNGGHFMPVKAEIRKKIGKKDGDWVKVVLYSDNDPFTIPDEIVRCLEDDPATFKAFEKLGEGQQKAWVSWITSAKGSDTRVKRIVEMMDKVKSGQKFGEEK